MNTGGAGIRLTVNNSTISGNGFDPFGTGGNDGYGAYAFGGGAPGGCGAYAPVGGGADGWA